MICIQSIYFTVIVFIIINKIFLFLAYYYKKDIKTALIADSIFVVAFMLSLKLLIMFASVTCPAGG